MNNEEIERKMNFIVEQQAQFASDIQQLQESQARTEQVVSRTAETAAHMVEAVAHTVEAVAHTAETVAQMGDVVTRLANVTHAGFTDVNAKINALVDAQIRNEENFGRMEERVARTEENIARTDRNVDLTDAKLRNLIALFDRHLREGRNRN